MNMNQKDLKTGFIDLVLPHSLMMALHKLILSKMLLTECLGVNVAHKM